MLFQLMLTKFFKSELFSCLPKVDHMINQCKRPIMLNPQIFTSSRTSLKMYVALFQLILFDSVNFGDWECHVGKMKCTFK